MYGVIPRNQVMMHMTFDVEEVEFLATTLANALEQGYAIMDFFTYREDEEIEWE